LNTKKFSLGVVLGLMAISAALGIAFGVAAMNKSERLHDKSGYIQPERKTSPDAAEYLR
jgi:hypothetical protein